MSTERVLAAAAERGITVEILRREDSPRTLEESAQGLGLTPHDVVKSLVVKRHDGTFLFALIPGDRTISWPKLRALLGVNKLRMPDPEVALEVTGYRRGTITPLGSLRDLPVYLDSSVAGARVAMGAGAPGHTAFVELSEFAPAYGAVIADISEPSAPNAS